MIVLFKKGLSYKDGDVFPIINIPVNSEGEDKEFTDFQWWGPTKEWNEWLKSNQREWQAESEVFSDEELRRKIYETFVASGEIDPVVMNFTSFNDLLNEDEGDSSEEATDDEKKRYTKFVLAYNRLKQEGKIKDSLEIDSLKKGETYAIISDTSDNLESRQAYKTQIISDLPTILLAKIEESLPFGEIKDEEGGGNILLPIAQFGQRVAATAIGGAMALGGTYYAAKGLWSASKRILDKKSISKLVQPLVPVAPSAGSSILGMSSGVATGVGIGILVAVAASVTQRLINWNSDNQAPTLSDLEDTGANWVVDSFQPGTIEDGAEITVCWTQSSGNGWFADIFVNTDTRRTNCWYYQGW